MDGIELPCHTKSKHEPLSGVALTWKGQTSADTYPVWEHGIKVASQRTKLNSTRITIFPRGCKVSAYPEREHQTVYRHIDNMFVCVCVDPDS